MPRNHFELVGRLAKKPELRKVKIGEKQTSVTTLSLAVDRRYQDSSGDKITDFFSITLWGPLADNVTNYKDKGDMISVVGELSLNKVELANGSHTMVPTLTGKEVDFILNAQNKNEETKGKSSDNVAE